MKNNKRNALNAASCIAVLLLLSILFHNLPLPAQAASSSEIRKQINQLKEEKEEIQEKIKEVQAQYEENENEIADIIAKKNVIDQEIQLLSTQITNMNSQLSAYNILIADKQDELDRAEENYEILREENKLRVRTMEEEGEVSYWEVIFKANSFSDLLDRLTMVEEIAAADEKHLQELSDAAERVEITQAELLSEKEKMELAKQELDATQLEMDAKRQEADTLIQELLAKADDLDALEAEFEAQEAAFLEEIAQMEVEYNAAKQAEWAAYMATYTEATTAPASGSTNNSSTTSSGTSSGSTTTTSGSSGTWLVPCSYTSITSPFGYRTAPTTGASTYHQGVDLDSTTGTPVVATRAGIVTLATYGSSAGNYVKIDHQDGFMSVYMHLNTYCVSAGQIVSAGQKIGTVGSTGVSTGDHLHFGIALNGVYVNPCSYVPLT